MNDLLNRFVRFAIYFVHLRTRRIDNPGAFANRSSHRFEQVRLQLNRFAVTLIGDVHRFDHLAIVIVENRSRR